MDANPKRGPVAVNRSMPPGSIIPELAYEDVARAAAWLEEAFGLRARLRIGKHRVQMVYLDNSMVVTQLPAGTRHAGGAGTHAVMVRVEDVDSHHEHAKSLGAKIISAPETFPFGERQYSVEDPGGHRWTFSQSVADVDPSTWGGQLVDGGEAS